MVDYFSIIMFVLACLKGRSRGSLFIGALVEKHLLQKEWGGTVVAMDGLNGLVVSSVAALSFVGNRFFYMRVAN